MATLIFLILLATITYILLAFLMPNVVFNIVLRSTTEIICAIVAVMLSFRIKEDVFLRKQLNKETNRKIYIYAFLIIVLMFGGVFVYSRIQSSNDKQYYESHSIEFSVIEHDEVKETMVYANVRRIHSSLEALRSGYSIDAVGVSLKEIHLYANHDSFIRQTGASEDTAAFFRFRDGVPAIYLPANLYLIQPESILHEVMHSFVYEVIGESFREIPLWLHDGYAQYASTSWYDLIEERIKTKSSLWYDKPQELQEPTFILYRSNYPSDPKSKKLFYQTSFAFVDFLELKTSHNLFPQILNDTSKGKPFNLTISEILGISLDSLYYEWIKLNTGLE